VLIKFLLLIYFQLNVRELNNTARANKEIIFFNRVPKVGSQTIMELIRRLSHKNGFYFHRDRVQRVESIRLAPADEVKKSAFACIKVSDSRQ
jgi:hypothetical protein